MEKVDKKNVLVIDDDDNLRTVLIDKLNMSGFYAVGASNGEEGLKKALKTHPDVILLDIIMPILNGWEMLKELRKDEWGKGAKVIMLTVIENTEAVARAVEDDSLAYLIKTNESMDDVVEKVKMMLRNN